MNDSDRWLSKRRKRHLRHWHAADRVAEVLFAKTEDDVEIALNRYQGTAGAQARRHPVVLCHGLAANRFSWDLSPDLSLAQHLADLGFDVYSLELRGHGRSQKAGQGGLRFGWDLFDYARRDIPAALEAIYDHGEHQANYNRVHWVGHSMGGISGLILASGGGTHFRSLTTLGSAIDYDGTPSVYHQIKKALPLSHLIPAFPLGQLSALMAPIALAVPTAVDAMNVNYKNVDRALYRRLTGVGFHSVSTPVLRDLATGFEQGGLRDGELYIAKNLPPEAPTLAISGTADIQCSPEASARHAHETAIFGRKHGHQEDYGHFDLVMGSRARTEVWPTLARWLIQHD